MTVKDSSSRLGYLIYHHLFWLLGSCALLHSCAPPTAFELELELIQTQMAQKPMLRAEVYARALRASQKRERERMYGWARDAPDEWAGRGRVREWKALVWGWRDL